jgi:hypothetical protein
MVTVGGAVEVKMGLVFRGIGKSDLSSLINGAIVFIENSVTDEIPVWQFSRYFEGDIDKLMMDRVLMTLEASNYIKLVRKPGMDQVIKILDRNKNDRSKIEQTMETSTNENNQNQ